MGVHIDSKTVGFIKTQKVGQPSHGPSCKKKKTNIITHCYFCTFPRVLVARSNWLTCLTCTEWASSPENLLLLMHEAYIGLYPSHAVWRGYSATEAQQSTSKAFSFQLYLCQ